MVLPLGTNLISAKNKMSDEYCWLMLALIEFQSDTLRIVANTEDIIWNGQTWSAFPFIVDVINDTDKDQVPQVVVRIGNPEQQLQYYVEKYSGGIGATITFYVIYTGDLTEITYIPEFIFKVVGCRADAVWVTFTLGVDSPYLKPDPKDKILKNFCRFKFPHSVDIRCPYEGITYTDCNKTMAACVVRNGTDSKYFGGFPSVGSYTIYV